MLSNIFVAAIAYLCPCSDPVYDTVSCYMYSCQMICLHKNVMCSLPLVYLLWSMRSEKQCITTWCIMWYFRHTLFWNLVFIKCDFTIECAKFYVNVFHEINHKLFKSNLDIIQSYSQQVHPSNLWPRDLIVKMASSITIPRRLPLLLVADNVLLPGSSMRIPVRNMRK